VEQADVVVCASGNLALVYFARHPNRLSLEAICQAWFNTPASASWWCTPRRAPARWCSVHAGDAT
jgi:hypothetical protein